MNQNAIGRRKKSATVTFHNIINFETARVKCSIFIYLFIYIGLKFVEVIGETFDYERRDSRLGFD